jgi:vacuolar-type H+-ATPase subunit E/Vma4
MKAMEELSSTILDKVKEEAQQIIKEAEQKAWVEIEQAEKQKEAMVLEEKRKAIDAAQKEAAKILAQASMKSRIEISTAKAQIVDIIIGKIKSALLEDSNSTASLVNLTREAIIELNTDKIRVYVSPRDMKVMQEIVKNDRELGAKISEIKETNCTGGVISESIDGKIRIDNTYDVRLEMLLPQLLSEIRQELFGDS